MAGAPADVGGAGPTVPVVLLQGVQDALHHGALGVARSLGRMGVPVFSVSARTECASSCSRYLLRSARLDLTSAEPGELLDAIDGLTGATSARVVLLPLDDVAPVNPSMASRSSPGSAEVRFSRALRSR